MRPYKVRGCVHVRGGSGEIHHPAVSLDGVIILATVNNTSISSSYALHLLAVVNKSMLPF
jgi:hypothetical protein